MKTFAFYAGGTIIFGLLAYGSMQYTGQFANINSNVAKTKHQSQGPFRLSHDWTKSAK